MSRSSSFYIPKMNWPCLRLCSRKHISLYAQRWWERDTSTMNKGWAQPILGSCLQHFLLALLIHKTKNSMAWDGYHVTSSEQQKKSAGMWTSPTNQQISPSRQSWHRPTMTCCKKAGINFTLYSSRHALETWLIHLSPLVSACTDIKNIFCWLTFL